MRQDSGRSGLGLPRRWGRGGQAGPPSPGCMPVYHALCGRRRGMPAAVAVASLCRPRALARPPDRGGLGGRGTSGGSGGRHWRRGCTRAWGHRLSGPGRGTTAASLRGAAPSTGGRQAPRCGAAADRVCGSHALWGRWGSGLRPHREDAVQLAVWWIRAPIRRRHAVIGVREGESAQPPAETGGVAGPAAVYAARCPASQRARCRCRAPACGARPSMGKQGRFSCAHCSTDPPQWRDSLG